MFGSQALLPAWHADGAGRSNANSVELHLQWVKSYLLDLIFIFLVVFLSSRYQIPYHHNTIFGQLIHLSDQSSRGVRKLIPTPSLLNSSKGSCAALAIFRFLISIHLRNVNMSSFTTPCQEDYYYQRFLGCISQSDKNYIILLHDR